MFKKITNLQNFTTQNHGILNILLSIFYLLLRSYKYNL